MYLEKILAADAQSRMSPDELALAVVQVPPYTRGTARGSIVRVRSYSRLGREAQQAHLAAHGMSAGDFGHDFAHPQSLAAWHGMDHLARGAALDHAHEAGHAAGAVHAEHPAEHAEHAAGGHPGGGGHGGHLPGLLGHMAAWEAPAIAHREVRRGVDRQTRRRLYRLRSRQAFDSRHAGKPPTGVPSAGGASGYGGGSSSSSGGGSSSSGGSSGGGR